MSDRPSWATALGSGVHPAVFVVGSLTVALGMMSTRVLFTLLYGVRERGEPVEAVAIGVVAFAAPLLTAPAIRLLGPRVTLAATEAALIAAVVAMQTGALEVWTAGAAVALALMGVTACALVTRAGTPSGGAVFARALVVGAAVDVGVHVAFLTWDPVWQAAAAPRLATVSLGTLLAATTVWSWRHVDAPGSATSVLPVAAVGSFLALQAGALANPAGLAAAGPSLQAASAAALLGLTAGLVAMTRWPGAWGRAIDLWAAVAAAVAVWVVVVPGWAEPTSAASTSARSVAVVVGVVLAQALTAPLLSAAASAGRRTSGAGSEAWPVSAALAAGTVGWFLVALAMQIDVVRPLPVPAELLLPAVAVSLGIGAARASRAPSALPSRSRSWMLAGVPVAILALASIPLAVNDARGDRATASRSFRLVSWNVHSAVTRDGRLDPAAVVAAIVAERADVVVLQEVARGWPIAGQLDLATWFTVRLDMTAAWGPAADGRFGNLLLSRFPIVRSRSWSLPFGDGSQRRSAVMAEIDVGSHAVSVIGTHLEGGTHRTRALQVRALLSGLPTTANVVVAGDLNAQPDDPDLSLVRAGGLRSVQDEAGLGQVSTAREPDFPGDRVDWIFVGDAISIADVTIGTADVSDHLPLAVRIIPADPG
jgi:endonuclease/exonuclease/phosphatase family metal-dependent hydrolase